MPPMLCSAALFRELIRRVRDVGAWEPTLATVARSCGRRGPVSLAVTIQSVSLPPQC